VKDKLQNVNIQKYRQKERGVRDEEKVSHLNRWDEHQIQRNPENRRSRGSRSGAGSGERGGP